MTKFWIKIWQEKILSSINLRECNFTENSLFLQFLMRVRPDGEFAGKICYPITGEPIPDLTLAKDMKLRPTLYDRAKKSLLKRKVVFIDKTGCICVRKFTELQANKAQLEHNLDTTQAQPQVQPDINQGVTTPSEEKRREDNRRDDIYIVISELWNSLLPLPKIRKLTDRIKRTINGRITDGYTQADIENAIKNYARILSDNNTYYFSHKWTIENFIKRANGFPQFIDWEMAHNNCKRKDNINDRNKNPGLDSDRGKVVEKYKAVKPTVVNVD